MSWATGLAQVPWGSYLFPETLDVSQEACLSQEVRCRDHGNRGAAAEPGSGSRVFKRHFGKGFLIRGHHLL